MEVHTRHAPAFGVVRLLLAGGEQVRADAQAMMAGSFGMSPAPLSGRPGGRGSGAVFTAPPEGGWLDLAPATGGEVYSVLLDGRTGWCVARDAVLAHEVGVRKDPRWAGLRALFGTETRFLEHYGGSGRLVLSAGGAVDEFTLRQGELMTVTPGFLLAYPDTIQCRLRAFDPAAQQSLRTGEGLAFDFAGPGTVLSRSRNPYRVGHHTKVR